MTPALGPCRGRGFATQLGVVKATSTTAIHRCPRGHWHAACPSLLARLRRHLPWTAA